MPISITPVLSNVFEKIVPENFNNFLRGNSLLPPSQFSYRKSLGTCGVLLALSHHLQVVLDKGMEGKLLQLDFLATIDRVNHRGQLYKLTSTGVAGQFLSIMSEFPSDRRQRVRAFR